VNGEIERYGAMTAELEGPSVYERMDANKLAFARSKMKGLNDQDVGLALELAASLGLNVWANEFYAARKNEKLFMMVGRDGLLRKAEEFPDYRGYDTGIVYSKDDFRKGNPAADGATLRERAGVHHVEAPPGRRGELLGSWAVAERVSRPPRYFFAQIEQYRPTRFNERDQSPWRDKPDIMIEKVAISVVHRTLCNLSGVYLQEEVDKELEREEGAAAPTLEEEVEQVAAFVEEYHPPGESPEHTRAMKDRLIAAVRRANAISPFSRGLAWAQMALSGRPLEGWEAEAAWLDQNYPEEPEPEDAIIVEEEDPIVGPSEELEDEEPVDLFTACPICGRSWEEHTDEERAICSAEADR
jgi:hypothetical protein